METPTLTQPQATAAPVHGSNGHPTPRRYLHPRTAIIENGDGFTVQIEMPGVAPTGLEITFEGGELTLVGHRPTADGAGDGHEVLYRESDASDYRRVLAVDHTVDATRIQARIDQGLVTLVLPKADAAKPRRIDISGLN